MNTRIFLSKLKQSIKSDDYVKFILNKYFDIDISNIFISKSENGKPYIDDLGIHYSISHKKNYMVAVFSRKEVGIDIEIISDKNYMKIANRYFFEDEKSYIGNEKSDLQKNIRFLEVWTKKEAYIKRYGLNLSYVNKIEVFKNDILTFRLDDIIMSICI